MLTRPKRSHFGGLLSTRVQRDFQESRPTLDLLPELTFAEIVLVERVVAERLQPGPEAQAGEPRALLGAPEIAAHDVLRVCDGVAVTGNAECEARGIEHQRKMVHTAHDRRAVGRYGYRRCSSSDIAIAAKAAAVKLPCVYCGTYPIGLAAAKAHWQLDDDKRSAFQLPLRHYGKVLAFGGASEPLLEARPRKALGRRRWAEPEWRGRVKRKLVGHRSRCRPQPIRFCRCKGGFGPASKPVA
jgi:predicted RNA-binding Zn-ribbon protein involved in translation (DUF1610 family)